MTRLSPHFTVDELCCKHCGRCSVAGRLVDALEAFRELAGKPVIVHSGYRCPEHNAAVGGQPRSEHLEGLAADISIPGLSLSELYRLAVQIPDFAQGGIGLYDGEPFIHVDVRDHRARWARVAGKYGPIEQLLTA